MKRRNGKAIVLRVLVAILCMTVCGPAFAAENRVLARVSDADEAGISWIDSVCRTDDGFCIVCQNGGTRFLKYTDPWGEPEEFLLEEAEDYTPGTYTTEELPAGDDADPDEEDEENEDGGFLIMSGSGVTESGSGGEAGEPPEFTLSSSMNGWFSRGNEIYALLVEEAYNDTDIRVESVTVRHVKLADGKAVLEDSGIPELDSAYLVEEAGSSRYYSGMSNMFTAGDRLIGLSYGGNPKVLIFDLTDGSCRDIDAGLFAGTAPGPDGSVLVARGEEKGDGMTVTVSRLDPADGQEEKAAEITGLKQMPTYLCCDPDRNTLYFVNDGQLWSMPQTDPEKAEALSEYREAEGSAIFLPDSGILLWNNTSAAIRSTEPEQREGITLRVADSTYNSALNEAAYEMGMTHSGVSVDLQQDGENKTDILKALLIRDDTTDIYVLPYDTGDFKAARDRGYLTDLGKNSSLAEATERMYPFVQEAVKRDGKTIAVPLGITGDAININLNAWKKLGGTEEELPRTWDRFFDWLEALPERLEDTDVAATEGLTDRQSVRAVLIGVMLETYQIRMDRGEKDYQFNTPLLKNLLKRACEVDYEALGIPEETDESRYETREALLSFDSGIRGIRGCDTKTPMALSFTEEEEPFVPVSLYAAFMNPYSGHSEEAGEFLSILLKKQDLNTQYSLCADRTEPVREPSAADPATEEARVKRLQKLLETADGDERVLLEEELREAERNLEQQKRGQWKISPEEIGMYREKQAAFRVLDSYFLRDLVGTGGDQEAMEAFRMLFYGDENGEINPEKALEMIDKKLRMKRMEGN